MASEVNTLAISLVPETGNGGFACCPKLGNEYPLMQPLTSLAVHLFDTKENQK
jgi:hypothetical protein